MENDMPPSFARHMCRPPLQAVLSNQLEVQIHVLHMHALWVHLDRLLRQLHWLAGVEWLHVAALAHCSKQWELQMVPRPCWQQSLAGSVAPPPLPRLPHHLQLR